MGINVKQTVFQPEAIDERTRNFFRADKRPNKRDFIDRILGRTVKRLPYWEVSVEGQVMATILENPMEHNSMSADPADCIELCRRTGLCGTGFGIYYSPCRTDHRLETRQGFDQVKREGPPDFSPGIDRIKRLQDAAAGTGIGVWAYTHGPFDPIYLGMDLQSFWLLTIDDPKFLHEVGDYLLEVNLGLVEKIVAAGVDWLLVGDDLAFKTGLMVRPEFLLHYYHYPQRLNKLIEPAKKVGLPVIFHSDGKIDMIVDMLLEYGLDAIHPIEPYSNDIFEIAGLAAGRIGLIGNVELATLTPDEAYHRTRELIGRVGPRYVPASSH